MTEDVADLGLGNVRVLPPDLPPAAWSGRNYGPPAGRADLRALLARSEGVSDDEVAITTGASMALTAVLATLPRPCSILCPRPHYPAYPAIAGLLGIEVAFYDLGAAGDEPVRAGRLADAVRADTRAILVNIPGNPAGNIPDRGSLEALAALARRCDLLVVSDEVYADLTYEHPMPDLRETFGRDRTVRVRSFSKAHGIPGERLGYVVGPVSLVERITAAHWALAMSPPATAQMLALSLLGRDHAGRLDEIRRRLAETRMAVVDLLARCRRLRCRAPQAGIFCWIEVLGGTRCSVETASRLASRAGVIVAPGSHFGVSDRVFLRASFALPRTEAVNGFGKLAAFIERDRHA